MHIGWLHGTEPCEEEVVPGCRGLAGEEVAAALEEAVGEVEEGGEDLRGANSVGVEEAEVGGADMFAPSPGKFTWAMTAAFHGNVWTNQDIIYTVSMETWWDDVVTMTYRLCWCFMFCYHELYLENKGHSNWVYTIVFLSKHQLEKMNWCRQ